MIKRMRACAVEVVTAEGKNAAWNEQTLDLLHDRHAIPMTHEIDTVEREQNEIKTAGLEPRQITRITVFELIFRKTAPAKLDHRQAVVDADIQRCGGSQPTGRAAASNPDIQYPFSHMTIVILLENHQLCRGEIGRKCIGTYNFRLFKHASIVFCNCIGITRRTRDVS